MSDQPEGTPHPHILPPEVLRRGTPEYRRTSRVLFAAGYMTFAMLYVVQGILPDVSRDFSVSPAAASLTLSLTTLPLAVAVIVAASWSEGQGRRGLLVGAVLSAALLTLVASIAPDFGTLLTIRILTGLVLAGLPAVAMAYIAEEFHPSGLGTTMGLYISGTGLGGMSGRLAGGLIASVANWRIAMAIVGGVCLAGGVWVAIRLPPSHHFVPAPGTMRQRLAGIQGPLRDPVIIRFALVGFVLYLFGTVSSNWMGQLTDKHSRRKILLLGLGIMAVGSLVSLADVLPLVLVGTAAMVFGFFGAHSVISGWVSSWGAGQRAQSSALYLFGYHVGSSIAGFVGGLFYAAFGWPGEVGTVLVLLVFGLVVALGLPRRTVAKP